MPMDKKIVRYVPADAEIYPSICVGSSAFVCPLDHTSEMVSNTTVARTSRVLSYDAATGTFETENSIYVLQKA